MPNERREPLKVPSAIHRCAFSAERRDECRTPLIEVSRLYYERKYGDAPPGTKIDLSFSAMLRDLDVAALGRHDAFNDALMTAMMYLKLRDLEAREVRIPRHREPNLAASVPVGV
jgi:DNA polymerase III subunit epsilon